MYATAPWLEALCAAPVLHEREAFSYSVADLAAKPADAPRFFKSHANFPDLPRGKHPYVLLLKHSGHAPFFGVRFLSLYRFHVFKRPRAPAKL